MNFREYAEQHGEFVHQMAGQKVFCKKVLSRLSAPVARDTKRLLIRRFFLNSDVKAYYLFRSVRMKKALGDFPPNVLMEEVNALDPFSPHSERVQAIVRRRQGSRRARRVFQFGPRRHALQSMAADVLVALHPPRSDQFTIKGGVRAALIAVQEAVQQGRTYAVERDIVGFYDNVRLEGLIDLLRPLPRGVIENVIWTRREDISAGHDEELLDGADQLGPLPSRGLLAQGAASSPIAAEIVVSDLLRGLPEAVSVSAYADNILMLGETEQAAMTADYSLLNRANASVCGPLGLKPPLETNIEAETLRFLGHDGQLGAEGMCWTPSHEKLDQIEGLIESDNADKAHSDSVIRLLNNWRRGYPLWTDGDHWALRMSMQLLAKRHYAEPDSISRRSLELQIGSKLRSILEIEGEFNIQELLPDPRDETAERKAELVRTLQRMFFPSDDWTVNTHVRQVVQLVATICYKLSDQILTFTMRMTPSACGRRTSFSGTPGPRMRVEGASKPMQVS